MGLGVDCDFPTLGGSVLLEEIVTRNVDLRVDHGFVEPNLTQNQKVRF